MEKTKTNKKSKSFIVMLVAILLCIAIVLGMGGFTYAKYISSKTVSTQTANVAKWGYVISVDESDLFSTGYSGGVKAETPSASTCDVYTTASTSVVAPGTSGSMTFSVKGSAEVRSAIKIEANYDENMTYTTVQLFKDNSTTAEYEPIKWTLIQTVTNTDEEGNETTTNTTLVDAKDYDTLIDKLNGLSDGTTTIDPGEEQDLSYTLSWAWAFEAEDDASNPDKDTANLYDTILGAIMAYDSSAEEDDADANVFWGPDGEKIVVTESGATVTAKSADGTETETTYKATTSVSLDLKITVQQVQNTASSN